MDHISFCFTREFLMPRYMVATTVVAVTLCYVVDLFDKVSDVVKHKGSSAFVLRAKSTQNRVL